MTKFQNLAFLPFSTSLRQDLFRIGLDFVLVKLQGTSHFMIITNQFRLIQELSNKHYISTIHLSDSRRQFFKATSDKSQGIFLAQKLGTLSRDLENTGERFLLVTEGSRTYNYCIE